MTDRLGRKKLFFITLVVYLLATAATALSWNFWSFALFLFLTGAGIGGEYSAIISTIQELIPARGRGWNDLVVDGSFWIGAALPGLWAHGIPQSRGIGPRGARRHRDARPRGDRSGDRVAALLRHRSGAGAGDLLHAAMAAGKSALADDA